jgi:ferritin
MLSATMTDRLNAQIREEFYSSNLYLQMSAWCEAKGLEGCASFLALHSDEERQHMMKLFRYVNETGSQAKISAIAEPPHDYADIKEVFETTFQHEQHITSTINNLMETALAERDFATFNFLQWYVSEQHEEEKLFKSILDLIDMVGTSGKGLFFLDQKIGRMKGPQGGKDETPEET